MLEDNFFKGTQVRDIATASPTYTNGVGMVWEGKKREWVSVNKVVKNWVLERLNSKKPLKSIDQIADEAWLAPVSFEVFETNEGLQYLVPTSKGFTNIDLLDEYEAKDGEEIASELFPNTELNGFKVDYFKIEELLNPLSISQAIAIGDGPIPEENLPKFPYQTQGSISMEKAGQKFCLKYSLTTKAKDPSSLSRVSIELHVEGDDGKDYRMTFFGNESGWYQLNANNDSIFGGDGEPQLFEYCTPYITDVLLDQEKLALASQLIESGRKVTLYDVLVEQQLQKIPWAKKGAIDLGATVAKMVETFRLGDPENKLDYNKIKKGSLLAYKECEVINS